MRDGYRIIDTDRHVVEPIEMWQQYLDPQHRAHAPCVATIEGTNPPRMELRIAGEPFRHRLSERASAELSRTLARRPAPLESAGDPDFHLQDMDRCGVDIAFLYPTYALYFLAIDVMEPELASAYAAAYNRWLHAFCSRAPARLRGVGALSLHDPQAAVSEAERVASYGFSAVVLRPNPIRGRLLSDPAYEPLWSTCERLSLAVAIHEGTHARVPSAGADRFRSRFALHACSHPLEQMMALLSLIEGGVLERHPQLRVAFLESGCGWLPYWLWRLDELEYKHLSGEVADNVHQKPSEYFRRQCFIAMEPDEPYLPELLPHLGEDQLLFGTDFPHPDHDVDIVESMLKLEARLEKQRLAKILWSNAIRFYGDVD